MTENTQNLKNSCWKGSDADWVIVVDTDEILALRDDGEEKNHLLSLKIQGYTVVRPKGWQVVSHDVPRETWLEIKNGFEYDQYSKLCCFNPKAIKEINYIHGCHVANPVGQVNIAEDGVLFHYRNVGGPERLIERHRLYRERMSDWNIRWKAGGHYLHDDAQRKKEWLEQYNRSREYSPPGIG